ncbi:sperm-associated antigen 1 isoform X3 [Oryzias melastigma]|uniref:sperm-associated antigen 1 isoform X3 n=1 Tax=Oryzias melastigma TaxID=30732 RepID=UPI000CF7D2D7|nr:sperm-associated antigen 1 isoform X3 [Oryzias melastigma]
MSSSVEHTHGVPVEHLDYSYIGKCKDAKHLEKILRELRSGKEGFYPHLIKFCESHLEKLNPRSRALRRENPAATAASLSKDEWNQIVSEMKTWEEKIKKSEASLKNHPVCDGSATPVRGSSCFIPLNKKLIPEEERSTPEYPEWMMAEVDAALMSQDQTLLLANGEEDDESFREKDFEEAAAYCSRSLSALPSVASFQSRAEAQIKRWNGAMTDCQHMSELEPGSKDEEASEDLRAVLQDEPQNTAAAQRLLKIQKKVTECQPELRRRGIFIHEAEEEDDNSSQEKQHSGIDSPEDLCILYSNRAACFLKDGNSQDCIEDCTRVLELQPFSLKPLLRRAMAYESLERYRKAYVDYKTVMQIDISVQAAQDGVSRITRMLIEQDGPEWREKLPEIPLVPLSAQQHRKADPASAEVRQARAEKAARDAEKRAEILFSASKQEGNDFVNKAQYQDAVRKYTECLKIKPDQCAVYTNRALCYLKQEMFTEAKQDCDAALRLEPANKKAFYRRALANKGLKDYPACSSDLQEVLRLDPSVQEAQKELEEVTVLLKQSSDAAQNKPRKTVPIIEVDTEEAVTDAPNTASSCTVSINLHYSSPFEFGQALYAARCSKNTAACAELLASIAPQSLPQYLSNQLDGHTISFIMQALDSHLLEKDPNLVYQHLNQLHTADRFSTALRLMDKRDHMMQLFERLSGVESTEFNKNDVQNLANKYI